MLLDLPMKLWIASEKRKIHGDLRRQLGAKEALVKFQPFIEGEKITLIMDHAALQWARVYKNAN